MANLSQLNINNTTYDISDATARIQIGDLSSLETTNKESIVLAVNELTSKTNDTPTTTEVETMISNAISDAIGGSY